MNKIIAKLSLLAVIACMFCSCGSTFSSRTGRTISFEPDEVRLDISIDDFTYLGKVDISVDYRTYLGIITKIDKVNDIPYMGSRSKNSVRLSGPKNFNLCGPIQRALYKVVETYPDADYYVPTVSIKEKEQLFLGSSKSREVTFKAYRFNK